MLYMHENILEFIPKKLLTVITSGEMVTEMRGNESVFHVKLFSTV